MSDSHYPPSVVAFLQEQDTIRAHRDRLARDLQESRDYGADVFKELEQDRFKIERLELEIERLTLRNDSQSRIVHRLVAKVETMALVMAAQVNEIKDEIERSQFAPPKAEPLTEEEQFYEGEQWKPDEVEALLRQRPVMAVKINRIEETEVDDVQYDLEPEIEEDVNAERIGRQFGAGFPEDMEKELSRVDDRARYVKPSLFPDTLPRGIDQRRYDPKKDQWADANQDQVRKGGLYPAVPRTVPPDLDPPRGPSKDRLPPAPSFGG